jgi:TetR/AcrR family transcriptional regulator
MTGGYEAGARWKMPAERRRERARKSLQDLTRRHIVDSAIRVMKRVGVNGLTMDAVAGEAGLAKGTLYKHFPTKLSLVRGTIDSTLPPLVDDLRRRLREESPHEERLLRMTQEHLGFFDRHPNLFGILLHERGRSQRASRRDRTWAYRALLDTMTAFFQDGIRSGVFRPFDPAKVAAMILDAQIAVIGRRLHDVDPCPVDEDAEALCQVFLSGLAMQVPVERTP